MSKDDDWYWHHTYKNIDERLDASVAWSLLVTWREKAGWLLLSPSGIPPVYLSINRLKEEGLYERVREIGEAAWPRVQ